MKIRASSFMGRVTAVFSRRSPGFQAMEPEPTPMPFRLAHSDLSKADWKENMCEHSGTSMVAALRDAKECAGVKRGEEDLALHASILAAGAAMSFGAHGFATHHENPWGIA